MKGYVVKGKMKDICNMIKSYERICQLKGIEPTVENVLMLKKQGW